MHPSSYLRPLLIGSLLLASLGMSVLCFANEEAGPGSTLSCDAKVQVRGLQLRLTFWGADTLRDALSR